MSQNFQYFPLLWGIFGPVDLRTNSDFRSHSFDLFPPTPAAPWAAYIPILLSEVEQEQRPSGNGDREAIAVGAGLSDGEGERAYTGYAPHFSF